MKPGRLFASLAVVWRKPEYRACFLILLLASIGMSSSAPLLAIYLVGRMHVSLSAVGIFFVSQALPGFVLGVLVGRWSDRWRSRLPAIRVACVWTAIGWAVFAFSSLVWLDFAVSVLFFSASGAVMGQVFAALHDVMTRDGEAQPSLINSAVRTGWSFGFVAGPLVGTMLAAHVSFRSAFLFTGFLALLCLVPLRGLDVNVETPAGIEADGGGRPHGDLLMYVFVGLCVLVLCGTAIKNSFMPIDVTRHLGGTVGTYGTIVAVSPIVELIAMPLSGALSLRFSLGSLIISGLLVATAEYFVLASSSALWQIYVVQGIDAWVVAVLMGLGLTYAQQLSPDRAGLVSGAFGSSYGLAMVAGNLIGSAGVPLLGVPHVFFIPTALCAAATLAFLGVERGARRRAVHGGSPSGVRAV